MEDVNNEYGGAHTKIMDTPALIVSFFSCSFLLFLITLNSEYILSPTCPKGLFILKYFVCMFLLFWVFF